MRTSADARLTDGRPVALRAVPYDDPLARELVGRVQQEYVTRYGGPDEAVVDPAELEPPAGVFLLARGGGGPAGGGGGGGGARPAGGGEARVRGAGGPRAGAG